MTMEITQKKGAVKHTFIFGDDFLNFAYKDKSGSGDRDVPYGNFPKKSSEVNEFNEWLRNVGLLWIGVSVVLIGLALNNGEPLTGKGFWMMMGLGCVAWAHYTKVVYTVFETEKGGVFIIQNKDHDTILEEIKKRRREQLLKWYGDINPDSTLENETNKYNWLCDQDVISAEEAEQKIAQLEWLHKKEQRSPTN